MRRKLRIFLTVVMIAGGLGVLVLVLMLARTPSRPALPNPNGYDDYLKASTAMVGDWLNYYTLDPAGLRTLVSSNAGASRLLRVGLAHRCVVPLDAQFRSGQPGPATLALPLAQLLAAEGQLRELDNRPGEAASIYAEAINFGNEISRGGLIHHRQVGMGCERYGSQGLARLAAKLGCDDVRRVVAQLGSTDLNRVSWDEISRTERAYFRRSVFEEMPHGPVAWLKAWWGARPAGSHAEVRHKMSVAVLRLLAAELALRCYRSEHGQAPARLEDLVPAYLKRVPLDPFSNRPMIYRAQGTNWLLYSVGPDGVDDGGKPAGKGIDTKGDLFFDSP